MRTFWAFMRGSFKKSAVYRFDFFLRLLMPYLMMYSVHWLWRTLYAENPHAFPMSLEQIVTYGTLSMAMNTVFNPGWGPQTFIAQLIKTGAITVELLKPLDFQVYVFSRTVGESAFRFAFLMMPSVLIGHLFLGLAFPGSLSAALLYFLSCLLGFIILFALNFLLGLLSVITLSITNISWAYLGIVQFCSGQIVPLSLFPHVIGTVLELLPFPCIYFVPISIYVGQRNGLPALNAILLQSVWAVLLIAAGRVFWLATQRRLVVQGG